MKNLWKKLAFKISLALMLVLIVIGAVDVYLQYREDITELHSKEERLLQQLTLILGAPLYQIDLAQIEKILSIYLDDPEVLAIHVSENERTVKHLGKTSAENPELVDLTQQQGEYSVSTEQISGEIVFEDKPLGSVAILFSREAVQTQMQHTLISAAATLFMAVLIVSTTVLFLIRKHVTSHLQHLVDIAQQLAVGNVTIGLNKKIPRDEIGQLYRAMQRMIDYLKNIANVADRMANQQLQVSITPQSEQDLLNHALEKMVHNLRNMIDQKSRTVKEIEQQNWLNEGLNQLHTQLLGQLSLTETCDRAVSFVARYVNAGWGVLYTYNPDHHVLRLNGAFAFTEEDHLAPTVRLGQGVIGQAALDQTPMMLTNLQGKNYRINTGTLSEKPIVTYTTPLIYNDELYGVMELASFEAFDAGQQHFLNEVNQVLAMVLFSALQRERVQELLRTSEQAILEAEAAEQVAQQQREEAQKANTLLEEQQQRLHQQSEEMQQINAHLEEQQQQLQQQSEELRQQNEHLQLAKEEMTERAQRLEQLHQYRLENFSGRYQELKKPLQTIIRRSQELSARKTPPLSAEDRQQLRQIRYAGQEISHTLSNMLELRRIESGNLTVDPSRCSTLDLLDACQRQFEIEAEEKDIEFRLQDTLQARLHIDCEKLLHILQNLLALTFNFTRNGSVTFAASKHPLEADMAQFSVIMIGCALSQEQYWRYLTSHERLDISISKDFDSPQIQGTIAKEYTKLLGGWFQIDQTGDEMRVVLTVPANLEALEAQEGRHVSSPDSSELDSRNHDRVENIETSVKERVSSPEKPSSASKDLKEEATGTSSQSLLSPPHESNRLADRKILIADDDMKNVFVLAAALEKQGAAVLDAQNGKIALEMLHQDDEIDMVLVDVMMPVMDGYTTMRAIRDDEQFGHLPVIALTAKTSEQERQRCIEAGANEYLSKPVDYDDLIRLITTWIEQEE